MKNRQKNDQRSGQAILLMILILGTVLLSSTVIAGLLVIYQLRQTVDLGESTKAIYAADGGTEWALYTFFCIDGSYCATPGIPPEPVFANGPYTEIHCYDNLGVEVFCEDPTMNMIRSLGVSVNSARAFEVCFNRLCTF
jgi:hypothetical protein